MTARATRLTLLLIAACARPAPATLPDPPAPAPKPLPGLVWITPEQPFQLHTATTAAAFDGATVVLAGRHGWIARFDPATHAIVQERRIGDLAIQCLLRLRDGRWFVIGGSKGRVLAFTLDPKSFEPTEVKLTPGKDYKFPAVSADVLDDGRVAIGGYGFPLALYDPVTWAVDKVLDEDRPWMNLQVRGGKLFGEKRHAVYRFDDLVTGEATKLAEGWMAAASARSLAISRSNPVDGWSIEVVTGEGNHTFPVSGHVQLHTVIDPAGVRLAAIVGEKLEIRELATGHLERAIDLGAQTWLSGTLAFDKEGRRLLITNGPVIRVLEMATGTITPVGVPPYGGFSQLAVANDGTVLAQGVKLHRLVDGKITATADRNRAIISSPAGEIVRYATNELDGKRARITLHSIDQTAAIRTWILGDQATDAWLASDGNVGIEGRYPHRLLRTDGERIVLLLAIRESARVYDMDLDTGFALVGLDGELRIVRTSDGTLEPHAVRFPRCGHDDGDAVLERRGVRVVTYYRHEVIVWDRTTGATLGTARFAESVSQVIPVRGRDEVIVVEGRHLMLWSVSAGELRTLVLPSDHIVALSPDAHRLAIGFASGQVALVDLAAMRTALPVSRVEQFKVPAMCDARDPFTPDVESGASPGAAGP